MTLINVVVQYFVYLNQIIKIYKLMIIYLS